jgi:hypothetical protein
MKQSIRIIGEECKELENRSRKFGNESEKLGKEASKGISGVAITIEACKCNT